MAEAEAHHFERWATRSEEPRRGSLFSHLLTHIREGSHQGEDNPAHRKGTPPPVDTNPHHLRLSASKTDREQNP